MSGILSRFRIEGLHNFRTIDISITENKLILVGENGTGKSTIANFIYFFLTSQWSRMLEYTFRGILAVINNEEYEFDRNDITRLASSDDFDRRDFRLPYSLIRELKNLIEQQNASSEIRSNQMRDFSRRHGIPVQIIRQEIDHLIELSLPNKLKEKLQSLKSSTVDQVLYLPTYRRIEQDLEVIFPDLAEGKFREPGEHHFLRRRVRRKKEGYIELIEFGMEDVEETINQKMFQIKENVREDLSNLTGAYLRDVIEEAYASVELDELRELDESRIKEIFKRIPEKILPAQDKGRLRTMIGEFNEAGAISEQNKVVAHFLIKLVDLHKKQQAEERDIREFVQVCNEGYLSGKQLVYDDVKFEVYITHAEAKHSPELSMRALSSGEKQIISLFSHLYLSNRSDFFIIIDEPELSLSVPWQQRFLPDLLKKCNGLIAVTHSPFIFDNDLRTYVHSVEEFIEPFDYDPTLEESELLIEDEILL
jgi:predicted ATPase